ncbi:hypothetical protein GF339_00050 [candidate division KSB3 bacterium]|uniref:Glycosyltransferase subfamily 4-like N-terminal domain-containing protein n=1 Tax=candidate division KSB3 bacterium TaxID=2044937 RepID=A0A9D5JRI8_9BACT|nr:hypothetical protein [candidate division KSB3 bacterium]
MKNRSAQCVTVREASIPKKKILIVAFRVTMGKRVLRQLYALREKYEVYAVGFEPELPIEGVRYFQVIPRFREMPLHKKLMLALLLGCHQFEQVYPKLYDYANVLQELSNTTFDLLLVHDIKPLPFVKKLHQSCEVLIDVHEYFFDSGDNISSPFREPAAYFTNALLRKFDNYLLTRHFLHYTHFFTVGQRIADEYHRKMGKTFHVITSAHDHVEMSPSSIHEETIRIIHHGHASRNRKLEVMIEMMDAVDERFELDLMLTTHLSDNSYVRKLHQMAAERRNVKILPPVKPDEIVTYTNHYDIGLYLLPETNLNWKYALPNKFFEFIQARLCIAIGPSVEMARIVKEYDLGIVAEDFQPKTLANRLNALTSEQIMYHKQQCHRHARKLSSETQMEKLDKMIEGVLTENPYDPPA